MSESLAHYVRRLNHRYRGGDATEHSHRPALEELLGVVGGWNVDVVNEPKRNTDCGAPDMSVKRAGHLVGFVETKDIGESLDKALKSDQLRRYRRGLGNFILTDYLEFRWFRDGEPQMTACIAEADEDKLRIRPRESGFEDFETLVSMFVEAQESAPPVARARDLAHLMAERTRLIHHTILAALKQENRHAAETGRPPDEQSLHAQLCGFRDILIHDFSEEDFADMYAQTICYGLFTARFNKKPDEEFTREVASFRMPATNPFLARTFVRIGGAELDDRVAWVVDDLARVLDRTDIDAILSEFRSRTRRGDPVVHFYETFLAEYAPSIREARGVYYTPGPVVSYIVRSVDKLLEKDFELDKGLANTSKILVEAVDGSEREVHKVQILDPAAGTGTFLFEIIEQLFHERFKGNEGLWPGYVREELLPRLYGFELLMAPYAIAHLRLNLKLQETYCELHGGERLNLYLTNALEEPHELTSPPVFTGWLKEEAEAAARVKRDQPIMVILGNPPYSGESLNPSARDVPVRKGETYEVYDAKLYQPKHRTARKNITVKQRTFIGHLLHGWDPLAGAATESYFHIDGAPLDEKNPKWLNDDYVKFIRFAQWRIDKTDHGILAFVTNHRYLENPSFRAMRNSLMQTFDEIYILDMHGNRNRNEVTPDSTRDQNVFDIEQGVAVGIFVKYATNSARKCKVSHADLWGDRTDPEDGKYEWLASHQVKTTQWIDITASPPDYLFVPINRSLYGEYKRGWSINSIFSKYSVGIVSGRDNLVTGFSKTELISNINAFVNEQLADAGVRKKFLRPKDKLDISSARRTLRKKNWQSDIVEWLYRPFDRRPILYTESLIERRRADTMKHILEGSNIAICTTRSTEISRNWEHVFCSDIPIQHHTVSLKEVNYIFPLYLISRERQGTFDWKSTSSGSATAHNLEPTFVQALTHRLGVSFAPGRSASGSNEIDPHHVAGYIYAVMHAPSYRERYSEYLRREFPRIPLTDSRELFNKLSTLGRRLMALHLMRNDVGNLPRFPVPPKSSEQGHVVDKPRYQEPADETPGRVWINDRQYFEGVAPEVWDFHVGGYQVCDKWLRDRKGRTLSHGEVETYRRIVGAIAETIDLMAQIDAVIEAHGGWPLQASAETDASGAAP